MQCAQKAKAALNGADIYAGCCTLKIEYARVRHSEVQKAAGSPLLSPRMNVQVPQGSYWQPVASPQFSSLKQSVVLYDIYTRFNDNTLDVLC